MTDFPPWLLDSLITKGVLTPTGITRSWKLRKCRACGAWILAGLDSHIAALEAAADPVWLSRHGEAQALLDQRATYHDDGTRLSRRMHWHIRSHPAGGRTRVLPAHRCGQLVPHDWTQPARPARRSAAEPAQEAPF